TQDIAEIAAMLDPENENALFPLTVERVENIYYSEAIAYDTRYVEDVQLYEGRTRVESAGVEGARIVAERVVSMNGEETERIVINSFVTSEPSTEIIATGTKELPPTASRGTYVWPGEGIITSDFGPRSGFGSKNHKGIDIGGVYGSNILASDGGEVIYSDFSQSGYGYLIKIRHDDGTVTYYAHCSQLLVGVGERVAQGQVIALMGSTGASSGTHLHFEVRLGGDNAENAVDPLTLLP
ncbi:MAG: peptidoglycan DD-metalloendopeptidase family protein, partial [Oscillospiraceae bacterium]|nr:peptidoglycan DD-metalloendopeptidase family protein [Oscillospiraceae bacterium]